MKRFKAVVASLVVFSMVMGNVGLLKVDFTGKGFGTDRATFIIMHDPNPGTFAHDPNPGTFAHDPNPGTFNHDPNPATYKFGE